MYKEFFGLRANPFNVNPDPRYLFLTRHTEEALACLTYGIQSRKGFVLLSGEVGTGKTTLINKLLEWLRLQQVATAFIFNSRMNVRSEEHTSELQSHSDLVCRLLLEKKNILT